MTKYHYLIVSALLIGYGVVFGICLALGLMFMTLILLPGVVFTIWVLNMVLEEIDR